MYRRVLDNGDLVEVDNILIEDRAAILVKLTPREGTRTALALGPAMAEALMDGLMIETVK